MRDCETIESIPVPHLRTLQLHPQSIIISSLKEFFITKRTDLGPYAIPVLKCLISWQKRQIQGWKPSQRILLRIQNWIWQQWNHCFVSALIAADHFMLCIDLEPSFLAAKFAIIKTIVTQTLSLAVDAGISWLIWVQSAPSPLLRAHGATRDLYWRNMVQLEAKGWEVWKRKALATSTWQHVPMWWLLIKLLLRNLFVHDKRHKIKCLGHCRPFEWSMCETSNHLLVPRFLKSD